VDNIERILPQGCMAQLKTMSWEVPPIFSFLQEQGGLDQSEMFRAFNNGIGMVLLVAEEDADDIMLRLKGLKEKAFVIGEIVEQSEKGGRIAFS
jgi:phosphoribosylformylglycinamidine cyclo-ligase